MPVFSEPIFSKLANRSVSVLDSSPDVLLPSYDGLGLANLPGTISHWLGGPKLGLPLLDDFMLEKLGQHYRRVVLVLVDALGYNQLVRLMGEGKADFWSRALGKGKLFPLTSISPSTTASALTTVWTGAAPNAHGIIGYEMWTQELSMVINTILHSPTTFAGSAGSLSSSGFNPTGFLGRETLGSLLAHRGIESQVFLPGSIGNSGLSQMHLSSTQLHSYIGESDLWANMRDLLNTRPAGRQFIYAYWSDVDSLTHRYGTYDERVTLQLESFSHGLEHILLEGLHDRARADTLFLVTADHGSLTTPIDEAYTLSNHPALSANLVMQPTCESRLPFLYIKPGSETAIRDYFEMAWPGQFSLYSRAEILEAGLLGQQDAHPDLANRVGDLVAVPHGDAYLWWAHKANLMKGRHGGLHPDEMLVPLFAVSLD